MSVQSVHNNHHVSLTKQGYDELAAELKEMKEDKLPKAIERVAEARSHGDLSENSEYHAAREDHAFLEGRLDELEALIVKAKIIKLLKQGLVVRKNSLKDFLDDLEKGEDHGNFYTKKEID